MQGAHEDGKKKGCVIGELSCRFNSEGKLFQTMTIVLE